MFSVKPKKKEEEMFTKSRYHKILCALICILEVTYMYGAEYVFRGIYVY